MLCRVISLLSRFSIPLNRFFVILCYALSPLIAETYTTLRLCVSLSRRLSIPVKGFKFVLRYASPILVANAKHTLRFGIPFNSRPRIPFHRFFIVFRVISVVSLSAQLRCFVLRSRRRHRHPVHTRFVQSSRAAHAHHGHARHKTGDLQVLHFHLYAPFFLSFYSSDRLPCRSGTSKL